VALAPTSSTIVAGDANQLGKPFTGLVAHFR
jgi:hypothetical protein